MILVEKFINTCIVNVYMNWKCPTSTYLVNKGLSLLKFTCNKIYKIIYNKICCILHMLWLVRDCICIMLCKHGYDITQHFLVLFHKKNRKWMLCKNAHKNTSVNSWYGLGSHQVLQTTHLVCMLQRDGRVLAKAYIYLVTCHNQAFKTNLKPSLGNFRSLKV